MKKFKKGSMFLLSGGITLLFSGSVAMAVVPSAPGECAGITFANTVVETDAKAVVGTAGNDLIFAGSANSVDGLGGDDCIVVNAVNSVNGGEGNDVIVLSGWGNRVTAGNGNDKVYDKNAGGQDIRGNDGNDYLSGTGSTRVDGGTGTDECFKGANGQIKNCELPVAAPVVTPTPWWMTMWNLVN